MEQIKFRAWEDWTEIENENNMSNKLPKKMYNWNELRKCNKFWFAQMIQGEHSQIKLMQFTGLKDKKGKEIYEGDIVRCNAIGINFGTTVIKNDFFAEHIVELKEELQKDLEVIGNIYENSELLEEKK